jgi:hypothetical protein
VKGRILFFKETLLERYSRKFMGARKKNSDMNATTTATVCERIVPEEAVASTIILLLPGESPLKVMGFGSGVTV